MAFIHWFMLAFSLIWIVLAIKKRGSESFTAAVMGAVFFMSAQLIYTGLTGKLPGGLVSLAKEVNENRAK